MFGQDARNSMPRPSNKKRPMYVPAAVQMSPKFRNVDGSVGFGKSSAEENYRRTQPNFHMGLAQDSDEVIHKQRGTPKLASPRRMNHLETVAVQQDLLNKIAEPKERRPYYLRRVPGRFRNTASSFVSEATSNNPESISHMVALNSINNKFTSNDDLADVSISKNRIVKESKTQRMKPWNAPVPIRQSTHMTNLAQAYSKGVEKLIQTLPFQVISRVHPIQTGSCRISQQSHMGTIQDAMRAQAVSHTSMQRSSEQHKGGTGARSVRKSIQLNSSLAKEDSPQGSGNLTSHASLRQPSSPLKNIKSSLFQPNDAYHEYDFTANKITTEYQSQNQLTLQLSSKQTKSPRQQPSFKKSGPNLMMMSQPVGVKLAQIGVKTSRNNQQPLQTHHHTITSTERNIQAILERADYHKLRKHRDMDCMISEGGTDTCTCHKHSCRDNLSKSYDHATVTGFRDKHETQITSKSKKPVHRNILSIQLRPLKGKASLMREYKNMIKKEYGKEKKKQIFETMYSPLQGSKIWGTNATSNSMNIKLNLRKEQPPVSSPCRQRNQVQLRTIQESGQICDEVVELLDEFSAEQMNMTMALMSSNNGGNSSRLQMQHSRLGNKAETTSKQFYLYSPQQMTMNNSRYKESIEDPEIAKPLLNLQIQSGEVSRNAIAASKSNRARVKVDHAGLSELRSKNLQENSGQIEQMMKPDEAINESTTEMNSLHQLLPVGKNLSRLTKNTSKNTASKKSDRNTSTIEKKENIIKELDEPAIGSQVKLQAKKQQTGGQTQHTGTNPSNQTRKAVQFSLKNNSPSRGTQVNKKAADGGGAQCSRLKKSPLRQRNEAARGAKTQTVSPRRNGGGVSKAASKVQTNQTTTLNRKVLEKLNENSTMNLTVKSELDSSFLQLPGTRNGEDGGGDMTDGNQHEMPIEALLSDFNNLISNVDTPDLSHCGAFASLDDKFDSIHSPAEINLIEPQLLALEEQKMRQQRHIEKKKQDAIEAEAHMGPLVRKSVKIQQPGHNHKRVSQISVIDEFYGQGGAGEPDKSPLIMAEQVMIVNSEMPNEGYGNIEEFQ